MNLNFQTEYLSLDISDTRWFLGMDNARLSYHHWDVFNKANAQLFLQ